MMQKTYKYQWQLASLFFLFAIFSSIAQSGTVTVNADDKIEQLLMVKKELEKNREFSDGFTIQLYYGNITKANDVLKKYKNRFTEWPASIEYETPNYKVWVGNYASRLEAERALIEIKDLFDASFILKPNK